MRVTVIKVVYTVAIFFGVTAVNGQPGNATNTFTLASQTKSVSVNTPAVTNNPSTSDVDAVVPIEMDDIPISKAIEVLGRSAGINYLIDTRLAKYWSLTNSDGSPAHEPTVTFRRNDLTARQTLLWMLKEHNLEMVDDPATSVARISFKNQVVNPVDASLLGSDINAVVPLIQLDVVPLDRALNSFAYEAHIEVVFQGKLLGTHENPGEMPVPQPLVSIRWRNITPKQAIVALCKNYNLVILKDSETGDIRIKPRD